MAMKSSNVETSQYASRWHDTGGDGDTSSPRSMGYLHGDWIDWNICFSFLNGISWAPTTISSRMVNQKIGLGYVQTSGILFGNDIEPSSCRRFYSMAVGSGVNDTIVIRSDSDNRDNRIIERFDRPTTR